MAGGGEAAEHNHSIKEDSDEGAGKKSFFDYLNKVQSGKNGNQDGEGEDARGKDKKNQNTIIQQINGFSKMAMNEKIATKTIEDHKYLLEHVDNRAAIAYFAVANRNLCLFQALKSFLDRKQPDDETGEKTEGNQENEKKAAEKKAKGKQA